MMPLLTVLTLIPAFAALIALFAGNRASVARGVAFIAALASLALSVWVWLRIGSDGAMKFVEQANWVPALGIEYHLGVDALGALMLLLSAIVSFSIAILVTAILKTLRRRPASRRAIILKASRLSITTTMGTSTYL